jgi:hypothetical protein
MFVEWYHRGSPSVLGMVNGGVCGLVCITPACGFVDPAAAFFIGLVGGAACLYGTSVKNYFGFDDAIDAFGVNFTGGIVGTFLTGVFATTDSGPTDGLLAAAASGQVAEGFIRVKVQVYGIIFVTLWSGIVSFALLVLVDYFIGLRVTADEERLGLDEALHAESLTASAQQRSIAEILNYEAMYGSLHDKSLHGTNMHYSFPSSYRGNRAGHASHDSYDYALHELLPVIGENETSNITNLPFWQGGGVDLSPHKNYNSYNSFEKGAGIRKLLGTGGLSAWSTRSRGVSGASVPRHVAGGSEEEEALQPWEVRYMDNSAHSSMHMVYDTDDD